MTRRLYCHSQLLSNSRTGALGRLKVVGALLFITKRQRTPRRKKKSPCLC